MWPESSSSQDPTILGFPKHEGGYFSTLHFGLLKIMGLVLWGFGL